MLSMALLITSLWIMPVTIYLDLFAFIYPGPENFRWKALTPWYLVDIISDIHGPYCKMSQKTAGSTSGKEKSLLRKGSHARMALKEKIVQIYEAFFRVRNLMTLIYIDIFISPVIIMLLIAFWLLNKYVVELSIETRFMYQAIYLYYPNLSFYKLIS